MFGDGDLTLSTLKLWSTLEFSRVFLVFADGLDPALLALADTRNRHYHMPPGPISLRSPITHLHLFYS